MTTGVLPLTDGYLRYRIDGDTGPWILFSNSLLTDLSIWDHQAHHLSANHRVLRYDHRGHGGSSAVPGPYDFAGLAEDAERLMDALDVDAVDAVGISMGGTTMGVLAARRPDRVRTLTMADCQQRSTPTTSQAWIERRERALTSGLDPLVDSSMERWFDAQFLAASPVTERALRAMMSSTSIEGYVASVHLLSDYDVRREIEALELPVLLLAGQLDGAAPGNLAALADRMHAARFAEVPLAGHLSCVDGAAAFTAELDHFLHPESTFKGQER